MLVVASLPFFPPPPPSSAQFSDEPPPAATMDPLQYESFSYRWLVSITDNPTASTAAATAASFIDIDPKLASLRRTGSFDFGTPVADSDELFSGGFSGDGGRSLLLSPDSVLGRSVSLDSTRVLLSLSKRYDIASPPPASAAAAESTSPAWFGSSRKLLRKYLCFLTPLLRKLKAARAAAEAAGRRRRRKRGSKVGADRRRRPTPAVGDEDVERSIHEAVLHCKKSINGGR